VGLCLELSTVGQEVRPTELVGGGGGVLGVFNNFGGYIVYI